MNHRHVEPFSADFHATVVAYAEAHTNAAASRKFGVHVQSVRRWRHPDRPHHRDRVFRAELHARKYAPIRGYCGICDRAVIYGTLTSGDARGHGSGEVFDIETAGPGQYVEQPDGRYRRHRDRSDGVRVHRCRSVPMW